MPDEPRPQPSDKLILAVLAGARRAFVEPRLVCRLTSAAYGWVKGLADHCSLTVTDLVWQSLMRQADASGYHYKIPPRFVSSNPSRRRRRSDPLPVDEPSPDLRPWPPSEGLG